MDRKKVLKRGFTILLLVLLGVEACMELRYPCSELSVTSRDTEKILRRTPEAAITEEDRAMMAELLALPSVQGLLESGESGDLPASENPDIRDTAETYLDGESAESLNFSAMFLEDGSLAYTSWQKGKGIFYLQADPEEGAYYKLYAPKRGKSYENWDNERAQESEVHRRWFAWLRDGMWKGGE